MALSPRGHRRVAAALLPVVLGAPLALAWRVTQAQQGPPVVPVPGPLATVPVPEPSILRDFVRDKDAAIRLGKALFWDQQVGSDGVACASCHFHAGADSRAKNQLSPGLLAGDRTYQLKGPNATLTADDFPFRRLLDPTDASSTVLRDVNDVASSQGVAPHVFTGVERRSARDQGTLAPDDAFSVAGLACRRVEPRNTPTVIGAIFNHRNFWDGRASDVFNGVTPFGAADARARVVQLEGHVMKPVAVRIDSASLASQAVGPPVNGFESSFEGRSWPVIGKKMLGLRPLAMQEVEPDDSVLGRYSAARFWPRAKGLVTSYAAMVATAFRPEWWAGREVVTYDAAGSPCVGPRPRGPLGPDQFTQMEANFSLFFGLAVQLYEATLVPDQTPFDRFRAGDPTALTERQQRGLAVFMTRGGCIFCHGGPEFTNASVQVAGQDPIRRMPMADFRPAIYDTGYYNIGVRPTAEDAGVGGTGPDQSPLSVTGRVQRGEEVPHRVSPSPHPSERIAVQGAFKTPGLRNVELTGPYFHNGGQATLRQVVDFYDRGGDHGGTNRENLDIGIRRLRLSEEDKAALVDFLTTLTDQRVRDQSAPFDHPQLFVTNGHEGNEHGATNDGSGQAKDAWIELPATGRRGGHPIGTFLGLDPHRP